MRTRCTNPNQCSFKDYGGRGITICKRWDKFENFLADMGKCPDGLTLERKNYDGNYEPSNCIWATTAEQNNNTRSNRRITFDGRTQTVAQWGLEVGIAPKTIRARIINYGWPVERALTEDVKDWGR